MTKRVKQHQLEDLSRSKFSLLLPRNWVVRDKDKDYGVDVEVEIFNKEGRATGLVYWVQLKATESKEESRIRKINLSIESIKYYKRLEIPVLIVRYSDAEDKFYYKWEDKIDLFYAKENAKTMRIGFSNDDLWDDTTAEQIHLYLKKINNLKYGPILLPIPIHISIQEDEINSHPRGILMSDFRKAFESYSNIVIYHRDIDKSLLIVTLKEDELVVSLLELTGCTFHNIRDREDSGFSQSIVEDILLGLASSLANIGQLELAAQIYLLNENLKDRFFKKIELLIHYIPMLMSTSFSDEILDEVCNMIDSDDDSTLEMLTAMSAMVFANSASNGKYQKLLNKILKKSISLANKTQIGISYYNLGNHYRAQQHFRKAVFHYVMARRFEPKYLKQAYYYRELAGALFGLNKYRFAAKFYRKALDNGAPDTIKPLYADALMFSGKYLLAKQIFSEYLESVEGMHSEWRLKQMCLIDLIDSTGIENQNRKENEAIEKIDGLKTNSTSFVKNLESAIELDLLCGLAWFNLGIERSQSVGPEAATFCFVMCGLVQTWDIMAWVNATLCSLNKEVPIHIVPLVIDSAYFFNKEDYVSKLQSELSDRLSGDELKYSLNIIDECLPRNDNEKEYPKLRMMSEDGLFRDIRTGKNE